MRNLITFVILALAMNLGIANEPTYPAYTIPSDSPISLREAKKIPPFLYFDGEIQINVTYTFNYLSEAYDPYVEFTISPTEESLRNLPYLVARGRDERPFDIIMFDKKEAAKILLGDKVASEVFAGKYPSIIGEASIIIHELGAGYECDKAVFIASMKKLIRIKTDSYASTQRQKIALSHS